VDIFKIDRAIEGDELGLVYQPIVDVATRLIRVAEQVAGRWSLLAGRCSLLAARWSLLAGRLLAARCSLSAGRCSLLAVRWSLLADRLSQLRTFEMRRASDRRRRESSVSHQ
jgi:hypothetical protein